MAWKVSKKITLVLLVICTVCITFLFSSFRRFQSEPEASSPNIIILVWSGVRFQDSVGDPSGQYIPHLKNELMPQGIIYSDMRDASYEFHIHPIAAVTLVQKV